MTTQPSKRSLLQRLGAFMRWARSQEPARVQAAWRAVVAILTAVGVVVGTDVDGRVTAAIAALFVLLSITQGEQTRGRVVPADNVPPALYAENADTVQLGRRRVPPAE
jgi:hypothetical protein